MTAPRPLSNTGAIARCTPDQRVVCGYESESRQCWEPNIRAVVEAIERALDSRECSSRTGTHPAEHFFWRLDDMSGCYDYNQSNDWDYNECKPRRRHRKKRYNDCWDYNPCR